MAFKKQVIRHAWFVLLVCLGGCTTISQPPSQGNTLVSHPSNKIKMLQSWNAQGSLAVQTATKGASASFHWIQQRRSNYRLAIFGPLGANSILLIGNHQYATLEASGKTERASDAEVLLEHRLGWYIPVNNIYYWGRGLPAQGRPASKIFYNEEGQIVSMVQQGWKIEYKEYNNLGLPILIDLRNPKLFIRIAIRQWNF
jgi:outer membrane lipoprotein LolB